MHTHLQFYFSAWQRLSRFRGSDYITQGGPHGSYSKRVFRMISYSDLVLYAEKHNYTAEMQRLFEEVVSVCDTEFLLLADKS